MPDETPFWTRTETAAIRPLVRDRTFIGIQALRGGAALLVVIFHAIEAWNVRAGHAQQIAWPNGAAGVDIFFVVSGFVMTLSARRLGDADAPWRRFMAHRLRRIVPLYWIFSVAKIAAVAAAPALALRTKLAIPFIAASFLFLPLHDATGAFKPLLPVGWTLTFEMLFYILFATGLKLRMRSALCIIPPLAALVLIPHDPGSVAGLLCNPILLEFAFGIVIAEALAKGRVLPPDWAVPMLAAATAMILLDPMAGLGGRVVALGMPAAIIVAAAVALDSSIGRRVPGAILHLGDASYAIYLSHGFVIAALAAALPHALDLGAGPIVFATWIGAVLLVSSVAGYAVHLAIEKPLLRVMSPATPARASFTLREEATAPR